jgi:hypothetical protein
MVDIGKEIDHLAPLLSTAQELTWKMWDSFTHE